MTSKEATEPSGDCDVDLIARDTIEAVQVGDLPFDEALAMVSQQCRRDGVEKQSAVLTIRHIIEREYSKP